MDSSNDVTLDTIDVDKINCTQTCYDAQVQSREVLIELRTRYFKEIQVNMPLSHNQLVAIFSVACTDFDSSAKDARVRFVRWREDLEEYCTGRKPLPAWLLIQWVHGETMPVGRLRELLASFITSEVAEPHSSFATADGDRHLLKAT